MSLEIVNQVYAQGGFDLRTKEGCGLFTEAVVRTLRIHDTNWGHLRKSDSQNHVTDRDGNKHAVDALMYRADGHIFDIIISSESTAATPAWQDKGFANVSLWFAPSDDAAPIPSPPPAPQPVPEPVLIPPPEPDPAIAEFLAAFERLTEQVNQLAARFGEVSAESALNRAVLAEILAKVSVPPAAFPAYVGRLAFSSQMRFTPEK